MIPIECKEFFYTSNGDYINMIICLYFSQFLRQEQPRFNISGKNNHPTSFI